MPEIILELAEGRTLEQKRAIVKGFTDTLVQAIGVGPEAVVVISHESPRTDKTNRLTTTSPDHELSESPPPVAR